MEGTRTSLWLFLLLNQLPFCPTDADQHLSTTQLYSHTTVGHVGSSTPDVEPSLTTNDHTNSDTDTNGTRGDCLIDTEMGLIAISTAGGLIVCLLVATVVLAFQVCNLQRRVYAPRTSRSNMDLVTGTGYWGTDQPDVGGLVGPCDASVMLEEVRADSNMEEDKQAEIQEAREEPGAGLEEGATAMTFDPQEKACYMPSSSTMDSCLEVPRDLEDMPLVVWDNLTSVKYSPRHKLQPLSSATLWLNFVYFTLQNWNLNIMRVAWVLFEILNISANTN